MVWLEKEEPMSKKLMEYTVWIEEETASLEAVEIFQKIPGYVEHEWKGWADR